MDLGLKGKVAMVAGASRGLGFAVAQALASQGAIVSIASRDEASICAAATRLGTRSGPGHAGRCAIGRRDRRWTRATEDKFGGIDLLFANSGGPPAGAALSFDDAAWQGAVDLLLFSALRMVRGRRAVDESAWRRRDPDVDVVVGEGADPESRPLHGPARVGVGARQDPGARARADEDPRQPDRARPDRHRSRPRAR